jgi:V8-like Glu-specific endopeptidase
MSQILKRGLSVALSVLSTATVAQDKVVYGADNRVEVYEAPASLQGLAASTAAMVPVKSISAKAEGDVVTFSTVQDSLESNGICADDRFAKQPTAGMCSGFLIGPDLLVTAGHCVNRYNSCESNVWVFGYAMDQLTASAGLNIPVENVYRCKQLINVQLNGVTGTDHGLVQLDRVVTNRAPLKFRALEKVADNQSIVVIGHPMGLPTKVSDGANVRTNTHPHYFVTNLDTFGGNSGSAVFNMEDLTVEGILVRGETDYKYNAEKKCQEVFVCEDDKCRGEDVTRITSILELSRRDEVLAAAEAGEKSVIESYLAMKGWVDMYDNARESILMKSVQNQTAEVAKLLLEVRADVNLIDLSGKTSLHHLADQAITSPAGQEILAGLVAKEVKLDAQDLLGETALIKAVKRNNAIMVEMLLDAGADALIRDNSGKRAIEYTKRFSIRDLKIRRMLNSSKSKKG